MNKRFEELAKQAGAEDFYGGNECMDLEKFAELLIKECARVAFESDLKMAIGQWGADSAILKHFGIKE